MLNVGLMLPPVVVGLIVFLFLSRQGPLGSLSLLYSPTAMVIAEFFIAAPVIAAITMSGVGSVPKEVRLQALGLGASRWQSTWLVIREARVTLLSAIVAGFGAAISEVGAVMMVGGNLSTGGHNMTGTMTTATMAFVRQGDYARPWPSAIILLVLALRDHLRPHPYSAGHPPPVAAVMTPGLETPAPGEGRFAIEAGGLLKKYGDRTVVSVEALRVIEGEVLAILGPNGAGKTTLFRLLALLDRPDAGWIKYFGTEVNIHDLAARRRTAAVFQRPLLFQGSVEENVGFGLRFRRLSRREVKAKVHAHPGSHGGVPVGGGRHAHALRGRDATGGLGARLGARSGDLLPG